MWGEIHCPDSINKNFQIHTKLFLLSQNLKKEKVELLNKSYANIQMFFQGQQISLYDNIFNMKQSKNRKNGIKNDTYEFTHITSFTVPPPQVSVFTPS